MKKFTLFFLLLFTAGCVTVYNPATGKKETYIFNENAEIRWGNGLAKEFLRKEKLLHDKKKLGDLKNMGEKLAKASYRNELEYHFYIIDEDKINAFALPGGHIFVYKGLMDNVSEDELAFVISHEIGHINARHALKRLGPALGLNLISALSMIFLNEEKHKKAREAAWQVINLIFLGYSREDEYQADSLGVEIMAKAGFDPQASIGLFKKFQELEKKAGDTTPVYLRTHPFPEQRIKNVKKKIKVITAVSDHKNRQ